MLVVQSTSLVLFLRYSRVSGSKYFLTTAVFLSEVLKTLACVGLVAWEFVRQPTVEYTSLPSTAARIKAVAHHIRQQAFNNRTEMVRTAVPALVYVVQNICLFVALSNLETPIYQVLYQLKLLTTAFFSYLMLNKMLSGTKKFALLLLFFGVALVSLAQTSPAKRCARRVVCIVLITVNRAVLRQPQQRRHQRKKAATTAATTTAAV